VAIASKEAEVYWHDGWDWVWMTVTMSFWVVALGVVVYLAVRLAQSERGTKRDS
jgi:heme/copper-type cytochrome/quinol oxidase subunit 2